MWVLEYSVSQDYFNIDTLERVLEMNIEAMKAKMSNDYKIIAICENQDEARYLADKFRREIE